MADQNPRALATAALMEIIGRGQAMQAAVLRGEAPEEIAKMRGEVHDVLEAYLDHTLNAAAQAKALLG